MTEVVEIEIERRFLPLNDLWRENTSWISQKYIKQAYPPSLQSDHFVGRVRSTEEDSVAIFIQEYKVKIDNECTKEYQDKLTREQFEKYLSEPEVVNLSKWRHNLNYAITKKAKLGIKEAIIDIYVEINGIRDLNKLCIIEVEFISVEAARGFKPPKYFGEEITGKTEWSNYQMCLNGVPTIPKMVA